MDKNDKITSRSYEITSSEIPIEVEQIPGPDFTIYKPPRSGAQFLKPRPNQKRKRRKTGNLSRQCAIVIKSNSEEVKGRGLACFAYSRSVLSITIRCNEEKQPKASSDYLENLKSVFATFVGNRVAKKPGEYLGYCPEGYPKYLDILNIHTSPSRNKVKPEIFLNDIYSLCQLLYDILFPGKAGEASGLIAVTGATDSSKSLITRGLIFLLLEEAAERSFKQNLRKPHLITFEDPIEQYYIKDPAVHSVPELEDLIKLLDALYLDYTPREKYEDAHSLSDALKDALRQTPSVVLVGETRESQDWNNLLEFAGSGHLVITTSHASSVVEAMSRVFKDTETRTPAQRSELARRLLGIINIQAFNQPLGAERTENTMTEAKDGPNIRGLLPAVWKSTAQSMNNLIADGLASLLPALEREREIGYYSRTYFARELTKNDRLTEDMKRYLAALPKDQSDPLKEIKRIAREWDVEGV